MVPLCWFISLFCFSASAENIVLSRESGENVTLKCFSAGCLSINEGYGMYLYHDFSSKEEVFYYYSSGSNEKITPRERYKNRIQTNGSLENHTVTITDLTVDDSGIYSCVYKDVTTVHCNVYTLCVREVAPCFRSVEMPCIPSSEKTLPLGLIIIATFAISTLVNTIFILIIVPRVKQRTSRRQTTRVPQVTNDNMYEVMHTFHPLAASEPSLP
ncbi:uncharacterized protein LOC119898545 [Micropterus salmoides]|uniref:uncharacterized protein LOC119898545 n=1 Tax=Micropterus salmoides TaxID=27706 RepID=UPI0018EBC8CF|nr:uncharacterized protein LOC119898545 [Micropterus salmoides]